MVSKCANPNCTAHLKYLHEGSLFVVPKPFAPGSASDNAFGATAGNQIEWFWLCESCAPQMRISGRGELVYTASLHSKGAAALAAHF
jgi:hypothetical protein